MGSKEGGSGNTAAFQVHAWRWALITFSLTASLEGGSEWIGGADSYCIPTFSRPEFVSYLGHIPDYFAVVKR